MAYLTGFTVPESCADCGGSTWGCKMEASSSIKNGSHSLCVGIPKSCIVTSAYCLECGSKLVSVDFNLGGVPALVTDGVYRPESAGATL